MPLLNTGILCWQGVATLICRKFLVPTRGLIWIMDEIRCWESCFLCGSLCHCATRGQHICSAILAYFLLFSISLEQGHSCDLFKALDIVYKYAVFFFVVATALIQPAAPVNLCGKQMKVAMQLQLTVLRSHTLNLFQISHHSPFQPAAGACLLCQMCLPLNYTVPWHNEHNLSCWRVRGR